MPFTEKDFEKAYPTEVYAEQADLFEQEPDRAQQKYRAWCVANSAALLQIYINRLLIHDKEASNNCIKEWSQQAFLRYTANKRMEQQLANEMKELMGE